MKEIMRLIKHYNKVELRAMNSRERQMPDEKADEMSQQMALKSLERAINKYIDKRIQLFLNGKH
jgi:hypothetical protein